MVDDHAVEEGNHYDEIGLQGFDSVFFTKTRRVLLEKD